MRATTTSPTPMTRKLGPYEARWYPSDGRSPWQWRLFLNGSFVFSATSWSACERFAGVSASPRAGA